MTKFIKTTCGWCGVPVEDYASNRRPTKTGKYYCSRSCAGKGKAALLSALSGGDGATRPEEFPRGKSGRDKAYYRNNVERVRQRSNDYYKQNSKAIVEGKKIKGRQLKQEIIDAYGGKCDCCGESTFEFLTIDHINGDGGEHRRQVGKGRKIYADIKKQGFPKEKYRLLCFNCNITLGFCGYCPHHPEIKSNVSHVPFNPGRKRTVK